MANKTRQQSKSERAQALMREQQRKERTRNWFVVGAVVVAIAIIAGVMFAVTNKNDKTGGAVSSSGTPSNLSGKYNVVIGKSSAPTTIKLYEDLQCPICKGFEAATGPQTQAAIVDQLLEPGAERRHGSPEHGRPGRLHEIPDHRLRQPASRADRRGP